jgi:hypothetical protein
LSACSLSGRFPGRLPGLFRVVDLGSGERDGERRPPLREAVARLHLSVAAVTCRLRPWLERRRDRDRRCSFALLWLAIGRFSSERPWAPRVGRRGTRDRAPDVRVQPGKSRALAAWRRGRSRAEEDGSSRPSLPRNANSPPANGNCARRSRRRSRKSRRASEAPAGTGRVRRASRGDPSRVAFLPRAGIRRGARPREGL